LFSGQKRLSGLRIHARQRPVRQRANLPYRMIGGNPLGQGEIPEDRRLLVIVFTHISFSNQPPCGEKVTAEGDFPQSVWPARFELAGFAVRWRDARGM
jgi:hypothetical protein